MGVPMMSNCGSNVMNVINGGTYHAQRLATKLIFPIHFFVKSVPSSRAESFFQPIIFHACNLLSMPIIL